jgi:hypothetical protein
MHSKTSFSNQGAVALKKTQKQKGKGKKKKE